MRVAFYAPMKAPDHPVPSGDRAIAKLFMQALATAGHDPELICRFSSRDGTGNPERQTRLQKLGLQLATSLARRIQSRPPANQPQAWLTYHLYHKAPDWLGPLICRELAIPYLIAEASVAGKQADGPWKIGHQASTQALAQAQRIFVINPKDTPGLTPHLSPGTKLVPMRPFLDTAPYRHAATNRQTHRRALADQQTIPTDDTWLLAVGMMRTGDKQASYRVLSEALPQLPPSGWQLLIVGDGPLRQEITAAMPANLQHRLHWLGAQPPQALPAIYAACDLMLWPAVNEAIGMALLEAQATGLPVVAGKAGAVATIVGEGVTGLLTPPGDAAQLAQATSRLIANPSQRQSFAQAAMANAAQYHALSAAAALLDQTLRQLAP